MQVTIQNIRLVLVCLVLPACATYYEGVPEDQAAAVLKIQAGTQLSLTSGKQQLYYPVPDGQLRCGGSEPTRLALLTGSKSEVSKRIPVDERFYLRVQFSDFTGRADALTQEYCVNFASFVPISGRVYSARQAVHTNGCELQVVDEKTGVAPEDVSYENLSCS